MLTVNCISLIEVFISPAMPVSEGRYISVARGARQLARHRNRMVL
jgi:hypothetical protein